MPLCAISNFIRVYFCTRITIRNFAENFMHMRNEDYGNGEKIMQRYVDILKNSGFKAVFGDRNNKDVVMSVINALLPAHRKVSDIEYSPTEHQGPQLDSKEFRYDFMCRGTDGTSFIVEVQRYRDDRWFKRCVSYASRAYDGHNRSGMGYDVPPVYLIGLMEDRMHHDDREFWKGKYISEYTFREKECHDLQEETIVLIFAELGRFDKTEHECVTDLDRMCYLLKNMGRFDKQPLWLQEEVYTRRFRACEISRYDRNKQEQVHKDMYDERKMNSIIQTYKDWGYREGVAEGEAKGRAEGRAEGKAEGKAEVAVKLLQSGMTLMQVAELTGLPVDHVKELMESI